MKKLFQKILSIILAIFIPTATVSPMAEPIEIDEGSVSASKDYILGGTNYGTMVRYLEDKNGVGGWLYSNGEVVIHTAPLDTKELIVPDEIDGYPVTGIRENAFSSEPDVDLEIYHFESIIIGDNVRCIGNSAFRYQDLWLKYIEFGENVEEIGEHAFEIAEPQKIVWNEKIKILRYCALAFLSNKGFYPPESIEHFEKYSFFSSLDLFVARENIKYMESYSFMNCDVFVSLNMDMEIDTMYYKFFPCIDSVIYCLENSTLHELLKSGKITNEYHLIENAYLTSDSVNVGEDFTVSGLPQGLTEETIGDYLNIEGNAYIRTSDETVKTGTKIELVNESPEFVYKTYTACIDGDINGDGSVNTADDITAVRNIISGNDSAFSEAHKKAADLNGDGLINSTDLVLMKSMQY